MIVKKETLTIALTGNPNSGKTTIFNNLTGTRQHVGNWPGVTVEKKMGTVVHNKHRLRVVDLPGTYSLTAYSIEEIVAVFFLNRFTSETLAILFREKEKPPQINPTTWDRLIKAELSAIAFEDYRVLQKCYQNAMTIITFVADQ